MLNTFKSGLKLNITARSWSNVIWPVCNHSNQILASLALQPKPLMEEAANESTRELKRRRIKRKQRCVGRSLDAEVFHKPPSPNLEPRVARS